VPYVPRSILDAGLLFLAVVVVVFAVLVFQR